MQVRAPLMTVTSTSMSTIARQTRMASQTQTVVSFSLWRIFKYGTIFKAGYARVELSPEQVRAGGSFIMENMGTLNAEKLVLQLGLERPPE